MHAHLYIYTVTQLLSGLQGNGMELTPATPLERARHPVVFPEICYEPPLYWCLRFIFSTLNN